MTDSQKRFRIGDRVRIDKKGVDGTIAYVGETQFEAGFWIGIILDEPKGKNNGTVQGVKYFECEAEHGTFVRESQISILSGDRRESAATSLTGSTTSLHSLSSVPESGGSAGGTAVKTRKPAPKSAVPGTKTAPVSTPAGKVPSVKLPTTTAASGLKAPARPSISATASKNVDTVPKQKTAAQSSLAPEPRSSDSLSSEAASVTDEPKKQPVAASLAPPKATVTSLKHEILRVEEHAAKLDPILPPVETSIPPHVQLEGKDSSAEHAKMKRDYEIEISKLHMQVEQLEFNKAKMAELHGDLQRQLLAAQRETREARDAASAHEDVADLHDTIEMLTLDKEMAEEKRDQLEREMEELKLKQEEVSLELELLKHEVAEGGHGEASTNFKVAELQKQNEKLTETLIKMHGITGDFKHEKQKLEKELKTLEEINEGLLTQVNKLQKDVVRSEEVIANLQEQADAALGAEEMVESLANQKLDLEDKLEELRDTVADYESMVTVHNEMIEISRNTERQLREQFDMALSENGILKLRLVEMQQNISESGDTVHKFRDLTRQLQEENSRLRQQLQINSMPTTPTVVPASIDFRLKLQDDKVTADRIERKELLIEKKILEQERSYFQSFMPDLYVANREDGYVRVCIRTERIGMKLQLIEEEILEKFEIPPGINATVIGSFDSHKREEVVYASYFLFLLRILESADRDIDYAIRTAPANIFAVLNELESRVERPEKNIQYYIEQLRQSRLDVSISVEYLESSTKDMDDIIHRLLALETNTRSSMDKLRDVMEIFSTGVKSIAAALLGVKATAGDAGQEVSKWLAEFGVKTEEISDIVRKIKRPLDTDNELRAVMLPGSVETQLESMVENLQRSVALCYAWYRAVSLQSNVQAAEKIPLDGARLKGILYSENDKGSFKGHATFYKSTATSPQQAMLNTLDETLGILRQFFAEIEDGSWLRGSVKLPEMPRHPLKIRAEALKKTLADAEELRSKLAAKDDEILEVRKSLREKIDVISELDLRGSMTKRRLETATKTEEEKFAKLHGQIGDLTSRLQKLQSEYDTETAHLRIRVEQLESDNSQLDEKLKQTSKRFLSYDLSPRKPTLTSGGAASYQSDGQLDTLRQINASLRAEIITVKGELVKRDMDELLPPLKMPAKVTRDPFAERLSKLKRQQAALETEKLAIIARTAVDLAKPKEEREKLRKQRKVLEMDLALKMKKIQSEIAELSTPGRFFMDMAPSA